MRVQVINWTLTCWFGEAATHVAGRLTHFMLSRRHAMPHSVNKIRTSLV